MQGSKKWGRGQHKTKKENQLDESKWKCGSTRQEFGKPYVDPAIAKFESREGKEKIHPEINSFPPYNNQVWKLWGVNFINDT